MIQIKRMVVSHHNTSFVFLVLLLLLSLGVIQRPRDELERLLFIIIELVRLIAFIVATSGGLSHGGLLVVLIKEVSFEHGLSGWILQVYFVFLNGFGIFPLLVINMIFIKIIILLRWLELRY